MAIYHCSVKIIGRSKGKSVIAAAAYRAGEKLYDRETGLTHDFTHKGGVVHREILLPDHAPKEYLDRQTLWESVTKVEKKSNAQFAREVEVALPVEFSRELQLAVVREYVQINFVSEGMCADIAIHDRGNGNPHAHILLTTRPIKADGSWGAKEKKDYARDENGERIPLIDKKTGKQRLGKRNEKLWKRITVQANDWNDRGNVEKWRESWADICNRYLSVEQQIDHRSYKRQGLSFEPTIHEGFRARQMEQRGETSDRCEYNRIVKQLNSVTKEWFQTMKALHQMIMEKVSDFIGRIYDRVARGFGYSEKTGRDSGTGGKATDGNRTAAIGEQGTFRVASAESGIDRVSGEIEQRKRHALQTESDIAETDSRIAKLKEQILLKVRERNERIRRLQQRRADRQSAESDGGYGTGTDRQKQGTENATKSVAGEKQKIRNLSSGNQKLKSQIQSVNSVLSEQEELLRQQTEKLEKYSGSDIIFQENEKLKIRIAESEKRTKEMQDKTTAILSEAKKKEGNANRKLAKANQLMADYQKALAREVTQAKNELQKDLQKKSDKVLRKQSKQLSGMTVVLLVAYLVQLVAFFFLEKDIAETIPVWFRDRYGDFLWLTQHIGDFYQSLYMKMATKISIHAAIGILVFVSVIVAVICFFLIRMGLRYLLGR